MKMPGDAVILAGMCGNGARIGTILIIIVEVRPRIPLARLRVLTGFAAAEAGLATLAAAAPRTVPGARPRTVTSSLGFGLWQFYGSQTKEILNSRERSVCRGGYD